MTESQSKAREDVERMLAHGNEFASARLDAEPAKPRPAATPFVYDNVTRITVNHREIVEFNEATGRCKIGLTQFSEAGWLAVLQALLLRAEARACIPREVSLDDLHHHLDIVIGGGSDGFTPW